MAATHIFWSISCSIVSLPFENPIILYLSFHIFSMFSAVASVIVNLDSTLAGSERPFHRKRIALVLFCWLTDLRVLDAAFHHLNPIKSLSVNDGLMGVLHQVHLQLPTVLFLLASQKIRCVAFLHQHLSHILLVAQHPVDGRGTPDTF